METARPYIIALDGRSGAGKTQFASVLASLLGAQTPTNILHLEDFYSGWDGLERARNLYSDVLPQLAKGQSISWHAWDWERNDYAEVQTFTPAKVVIIEGVGAAGSALAEHLNFSIWLDAPETIRRHRALARDGETYRPHWQMWAEQEDEYLRLMAPQQHATLRLNADESQSPEAQLRRLAAYLPASLRTVLPASWQIADPEHRQTFPEPTDVAAFFEAISENTSRAALLESTSHRLSDPLDRNRYSIIALARHATSATLRADQQGTILESGEARLRLAPSFFDSLAGIWPAAKQSAHEYPRPSWVGYLGYELRREVGSANLRTVLADGTIRPDAQFFCPDTLLVIDHREAKMFLHCQPADAKTVSAHVAEHLNRVREPRALPQLSFVCADTAEGYQDKVRETQRQIYEGNTYEACLTTVLQASSPSYSPFEAYCRMRQTSPAPFAHYLRFNRLEVASISPERFVALEAQGRLRAEPIKGTRPRGKTVDEDLALAQDLATHPKDRAENIMIVDLLRNDLSHYAVPGSVVVKRLCAVETYATVHQMVSTIDATLSDQRLAAFALREAFPPGSMTGAPKLSSMQILDGLEDHRPRGLYSGAVGYLSDSGAADFSVVIRTLVCDQLTDDSWSISLGLGGAITADSDPVEEWEEVITKSVGVLSALGTSFPHPVAD